MKYKVTYHGGEIGDDWTDETTYESFAEAVSFCEGLMAKNKIFINDVTLPYTILSVELVTDKVF